MKSEVTGIRIVDIDWDIQDLSQEKIESLPKAVEVQLGIIDMHTKSDEVCEFLTNLTDVCCNDFKLELIYDEEINFFKLIY